MRAKALREWGPVLLLFAVNAAICRELFWTEYTRHMGSIEAAYIGLSRYILENWRDLSWFPLWYGGIPFQNTYPPLLHVIVAAFAAASSVSPALAHHAVTAAFYCAGPVTLYWLARRLEANVPTALVAALLYSLLSPSALLVPAVAGDMGTAWAARRLHALVHYGEGPHVAAMTLVPAAVALLAIALEKRKPTWYFAAVLALAAVPLTNWLGAAALAAAALCLLLAARASSRTWALAAMLALYAYALASPWIPPSTLAAVRTNAQWVGGDYRIGAPHLLYWAVALALLLALHLLLCKAGVSQLVHFAALFTLLSAGVTLAAHWGRLALLPQPERYHLEMEMALALLAGAGLAKLAGPGRRLTAAATAVALAAGFVSQYRSYRRFARELIQPLDITRTIEYRMARWFDRHVGDRRVMAPGSVSFWLNAFSDTPQLGGGFDQGITNPLIPHVVFQVYSGMNAGAREGEIALLWLKAFGVHAVAVGGPASREYYRPFRNPEKFAGLLKELWREGDDVVYAIPQRSGSLARVVPRERLLEQTPPTAVDVEPLRPFVKALDDPLLPTAQWRWLSRREAVIAANMQKKHAISVAMNFHPGWQAAANGKPARLRADGLGLMVIEPDCDGDCRIELKYTGGRENLAVQWLSRAALLAGLVWLARPLLRKKQ